MRETVPLLSLVFLFLSNHALAGREIKLPMGASTYYYVTIYNPSEIAQPLKVEFVSDDIPLDKGGYAGGPGGPPTASLPIASQGIHCDTDYHCTNDHSNVDTTFKTIQPGQQFRFGVHARQAATAVWGASTGAHWGQFGTASSGMGVILKITVNTDLGYLVGGGLTHLDVDGSGGTAWVDSPVPIPINGGKPF